LLTLKNVHFVKLSKYGMDFIAFLSLRWSKNIYGTSNSKSGWRSYAPGKMLRCRDFWRPGLLTRVGTSDPCRDFRRSGLLTRVRTSDPCRDFRRSGLLTRVGTSGRPNKKGGSDLAFWMSIQTVLNSWETWKIRLGEVFYWDKTTPLYIWEDHGRLSFHLSNRQNNNQNSYFTLVFSSQPSTLLFSKPLHKICWHPRWPCWS
jgi:hypothetical protein